MLKIEKILQNTAEFRVKNVKTDSFYPNEK